MTDPPLYNNWLTQFTKFGLLKWRKLNKFEYQFNFSHDILENYIANIQSSRTKQKLYLAH